MAATDRIEYSMDMTILLAAILGNVCAWIVHVAVGRLHEKFLVHMAWGFVMSGAGLAVGCICLRLTNSAQNFITKADIFWTVALAVCGACVYYGMRHGRWHERAIIRKSFLLLTALAVEGLLGALFMIVVVLLLPLDLISSITRFYRMTFDEITFASFWITLLLLNLLRPLLAQNTQRFWNTRQPKSETK